MYTCPTCGKECTKPNTLVKHLLSHQPKPTLHNTNWLTKPNMERTRATMKRLLEKQGETIC